jgi:hypothetical protein
VPQHDNPLRALTEYDRRNVVAHLTHARLTDDVRRLLTLETTWGRNAWYEAKFNDVDSYLLDVATALEGVQELARAEPVGAGRWLGEEYRYALMLTSVNSIAATVPPPLLVALVQNRLLSKADASSYARRASQALQRAEALTGLLPYLEEGEREDVLAEVVHELDSSRGEVAPSDWSKRAELPAAAARHFAPPRRSLIVDDVIQQLEREIATVDDEEQIEYGYVEAVRTVASYVTAVQAQRLFDLATRSAEDVRAELLPLVVEGTDDALLRRVLAEARKLGRAWLLEELAPRFPARERNAILRDAAVEAAFDEEEEDEEDPADRALALLRAAELVDETSERERLRDEALEGLAELEPPSAGYVLEQLAELGQRLPPPRKERLSALVLAAARAISNGSERAAALARVSDHLDDREAVLVEAFEELRSLDRIRRDTALEEVAPRLPPPMLLEARRLVETVGDERDRAATRAALTPYLSPRSKRQISSAIEAAREHRPSGRDILIALAVRASAGERARILDQVLDLVEYGQATEAAAGLGALVPCLDLAESPKLHSVWERSLRIARDLQDDDDRAVALAELAGQLDDAAPERSDLLAEALRMAYEVRDIHLGDRVVTLARVAAELEEPERSDVLADVADEAWLLLERARANRRRWGRVGVDVPVATLAFVATRLDPDEGRPLAREVVKSARRLPGHMSREKAIALATLAPTYHEPHRSRLLREAFSAARREFRKETLALLASDFDEPERSAALAEALPEARKSRGLWTSIASTLASMPEDAAYRVLRNPPARLTTLPRRNVLTEIQYVAPLIHGIGGIAAAAEVADAIDQSGRWWP